MNLLSTLSVTLANIGCADMHYASEANKDNLRYVKAVIKHQGARVFQFASDRIRSDAKSILKLVDFNPETIRFSKKIIMDRYTKDNHKQEKEVDYLIFAFKCLESHVSSLLYFDCDLQDKVIEALETKEKIEGEFEGVPCTIYLREFKQNQELKDIVEAVQRKSKTKNKVL